MVVIPQYREPSAHSSRYTSHAEGVALLSALLSALPVVVQGAGSVIAYAEKPSERPLKSRL